MSKVQKKKSWFRRHWIITSLLVLIIIGIIGNASDQSNLETFLESNQTSGFTVNDCYNLCERYCLQSQTDNCQFSCQMIGKPGKALDKVVLSLKNHTANLEC